MIYRKQYTLNITLLQHAQQEQPEILAQVPRNTMVNAKISTINNFPTREENPKTHMTINIIQSGS